MKSYKQILKERLAKEAGGQLVNDGKKWTPEEMDKFLDMWLAGKAEHTIFKALGRSASSASTILWKIVAQYRGLSYVPGARVNRTKQPWNRREEQLLHLALRRRGQNIPIIADLLARTKDEVSEQIRRKRR